MPVRRLPQKFAFAVTLESADSERGVRIVASPVEEAQRLVTHRSTVVVSLWCEADGIVRGTIRHGSGATAYIQGGKPLIELARRLGLEVKS